jgi:hypothetical protein
MKFFKGMLRRVALKAVIEMLAPQEVWRFLRTGKNRASEKNDGAAVPVR